MSSHGVQSMDSALKEAQLLGITVRQGKGGEWVVQIPTGKKMRLNKRRKDAPRCLLKEIQRARTATAPGERTQ